MKKSLEDERPEKYVGVPEFAEAAARQLAELGLVQERGSVTAVPAERTIRYYLSEGLIPPTDEKQGTASVFSYPHLLQLLVVKKLQAQHLPIRKIRELVAGRNERQLERLLGLGDEQEANSKERKKGDDPPKNDATRYLQSLLTKSSQTQIAAPIPQAAPAMRMAAALSDPSESDETKSWERIEVEPGLELHVRSDYRPPADSGKKSRLVERIAKFIKQYR
jgi:DNA-binding transcriptional MerR regulator